MENSFRAASHRAIEVALLLPGVRRLVEDVFTIFIKDLYRPQAPSRLRSACRLTSGKVTGFFMCRIMGSSPQSRFNWLDARRAWCSPLGR